jgi:hypothetical protein
MTESMPVAKSVRIRDCGFDEVWLQDQIAENPSVLGLGELELVSRERRQSSGGKMDILLKDPEDDSMYEVEVMLGETDETHIIRTIEYWSRERRKWPKRQHTPVLVAEHITRRFFDVIQVLSHAIPLIAIQASVVEAGNMRMLSITKILDAYDEPEDKESAGYETHDEGYWQKKSQWTAENAKILLGLMAPMFPGAVLNFAKFYIAISADGHNYFYLHERAAGRSLLECWVGDSEIQSAKQLLDAKGIQFTPRKNESLRIWIDKSLLNTSAQTFVELGKLVRKAWS